MRYEDTELPVVLDVRQIISFHYFKLECRRHPVSHWGKDALAVLLRTGKEFLEGPYDDFGQEKLRWKPNAPETAGQLLKNRIENFFLLLLQESREDAQDTADRYYQEPKVRETVEKVTGILSENLYGSLTLEQVAGQSALSQSYIEKMNYSAGLCIYGTDRKKMIQGCKNPTALRFLECVKKIPTRHTSP